MRLFLDAMMLVSSCLYDNSHTRKVIYRLSDAGHELVTSWWVLDEAWKSIQCLPTSGDGKRFDRLTALINDVTIAMDAVPAKPAGGVSLDDPNDLPVLLTAAKERCDYLLSRDSDFNKLYGETFHGVRVVRGNAILGWVEC